MTIPAQFEHVTAIAKANIYFDGKVISHTILMPDGAKKTLGVIFPGSYHFNTGAPEVMKIVAGQCAVKLQGRDKEKSYSARESFDVPGNSAFDIRVDSGICEYICSFG